MTTKKTATQKAKEIKEKLKKLNPSLYNRTTGKKLKNRFKDNTRKGPFKGVPGVPGKKKPNTSKLVPGGPFDPRKRKDPVPGGPYKPEKGPKFVTPMTLKGGPTLKGEKKKRPKKFNLGGEAATSVGRATVVKSQREEQRKRMDEMLKRVYGTGIRPKPKPKPKNPNRIKLKPKPKKPIDPKGRKPKGIGFKGKPPVKPSLKKRLADQAKKRR